MMLMREVIQLKIDELFTQHSELLEMYRQGKCSVDYFKEQGVKILGEIRGMSYALGAQELESDLGLEK